MAWISRAFTIAPGTTPTPLPRLEGQSPDTTTERGGRPPADYTGFGVEITAPDASDLYVGGSDVTTTGTNRGRLIRAGTALSVDCDPREQGYALLPAATATAQTGYLFATGA
jgi:hypothetical protein